MSNCARVVNAYAGVDRSRMLVRETARVLVVIVSALASWVVTLSGISRPLGLYVLVAYAVVAYVLISALPHCSGPTRCALRDTIGRHTHSPGISSVLATTVCIWVAWFIVAHLFFEADLLVAERPSALTVVLFISTAAAVIASSRPTWAAYESAAGHVALVAFALCLAMPTCDWVPQTAHCVATAVRVALFFLASSLIDILAHADAAPDVGDYETGVSAPSACLIADSAMALVASEERRTRRIVALCAWLLVTSGVEMVLFAVALAAIGVLAYGDWAIRTQINVIIASLRGVPYAEQLEEPAVD